MTISSPQALAKAAVAARAASRQRERLFALRCTAFGIGFSLLTVAFWAAVGVADPYPYPF
jgi:hypothetical protein